MIFPVRCGRNLEGNIYFCRTDLIHKDMKTDTIKQYQDAYSESGFWDKIRKVARQSGIRVVYCAMLLYYVLRSPEVSWEQKSIILGALGYFILPIDLIPDFIPVAGFTDDLSALLAAYAATKHCITPEIRLQAKRQVMQWFGDRPVRLETEPEDQ